MFDFRNRTVWIFWFALVASKFGFLLKVEVECFPSVMSWDPKPRMLGSGWAVG